MNTDVLTSAFIVISAGYTDKMIMIIKCETSGRKSILFDGSQVSPQVDRLVFQTELAPNLVAVGYNGVVWSRISLALRSRLLGENGFGVRHYGREKNLESGSIAEFTVDPDMAAVLLDDTVRRGKLQLLS